MAGKKITDIKFGDKQFFIDFAEKTINQNLSGIEYFLERFNAEYEDKTSNKNTILDQQNKIDSYNDIKKTTYYNIKTLHEMMSGIVSTDTNGINLEPYISNPNAISKINIGDLKDLTNLFNTSTPDCDTPGTPKSFYDLYEIFQVVDRGNNDIGYNVLANLATLYKNLYVDFNSETFTAASTDQKNQETQIDILTTRSVNNLFSLLAKESGFLTQQIPNYLNVNGSLPDKYSDEEISELVDHMFGVHTDIDLFGDTFNEKRDIKFGGPLGLPGYIFQLGTLSSTPNDDKNIKNNFTNSFCLDIVLNGNNEVEVNSDDAPDDILNSNVTSFVVDFGKQNQQMFKSVQLDTAQFYDTEESIKTWVNLVNETGTGLQTTNIFPILEKRSYTCNVVGLGNATIQPLSYFYLRNVPLFYGTYWITNVSHRITPNTMVTEFKGVRQPIATKGDTRKALLRLMKEKIVEIEKANKEANTIETEGMPDTYGNIKIVDDSTNPFKDFAQDSDRGYFTMDGKEILGAYIYSITGTNKMTAANIGIVSYLYNIASKLTEGSDSSVVLPNMVKVAIKNMKSSASDGDQRYTDSSELSLSYLLKNSGKGFIKTDDLGDYLDELKSPTYLKLNSKLSPNTKGYNLQATSPDGTAMKDGESDVIFKSPGQLNGFNSSNIELSKANIFLDPAEKWKSNYSYVAFDNKITTYDLFKAYDGTNFIVNTLDDTDVSPKSDIDKKTADDKFKTEKPKTFAEIKETAKTWQRFFVNDNKGDITSGQMDRLKTFALFDSDGTYDAVKLRAYLGVTDGDTWGKIYGDIKSIIPQNKNNFPEAIFRHLGNFDGYYDTKFNTDKQTVRDPSGTDDLSFSLNVPGVTSTFYSYSLDNVLDSTDVENFNKFIEKGKDDSTLDVKGVYDQRNSYYETELEKQKIGEKQTPYKVKYWGAYSIGETDTNQCISFFQSYHNFTLNKEKYNLDSIKQSEIVVNNSNTKNGELRSGFLTRIIQVVKDEQRKWTNADGKLINECDTEVSSYLDEYWKAVGTDLRTKGGCGVAWSAAFISYAVKSSGAKEFPYSAVHGTYIKKARENKNSGGNYSWYGYDAKTKEAIVEEGDIVCYTNGDNINTDWNDITDNPITHCHCDVVVSIDNQNKARTIGGNVADTVGGDSLQLNDDHTININSPDSTGGTHPKIYRGVLKYQPVEKNPITKTNLNDKKSVDLGIDYTISFLKDVLRGLGIPNPNESQISFIKAWRQHEGARATFNPFNTMQPAENTTNYLPNGVKNYASREQGLKATLDTLNNGLYNKVIEAIKNIKVDEDINKAMIAVNESPWGSKFDPVNYKAWRQLNNTLWGYV